MEDGCDWLGAPWPRFQIRNIKVYENTSKE